MRANTSFQSILERKLGQDPERKLGQDPERKLGQDQTDTPSARTTSATVDQDPAHLAFLLGALNKSTYQGPLTKVYPTRPKPPPPPHSLNSSQQIAYEFFVSHCTQISTETGLEGTLELGPAFTQKQLKNAFRRVALRLHPDMNKGASGPFIELKQHYEELLQIFP
jgi:hypothetical protein